MAYPIVLQSSTVRLSLPLIFLSQMVFKAGTVLTVSIHAPILPSLLKDLITLAERAASPTTGIAPITEVK
jgi:hypothetical protein